MAFTREEIEQELETAGIRTNSLSFVKLFQETDNYKLILDYLTGVSKSLTGMQHDYGMHHSGVLLNLLKNIEPPNVKDHLVLQVIRHPQLMQFLIYSYSIWLFKYAQTHHGSSSSQAVLSQFKSIGVSDQDIFFCFASQSYYNQLDNIQINGTVVKDFMVDYLRKAKQLPNPINSNSNWPSRWNGLFLNLLEEVRPEFANEYAVFIVTGGDNNDIEFLEGYRNGHYMPVLTRYLANRQNQNQRTIQMKFAAAARLYEINSEKYQSLASDLSRQYLEYESHNNPRNKWEVGRNFQYFKDLDNDYYPYSSFAFHILLLNEREIALELLRDFFSRKVYITYKTLKVLAHHLGKEAFPFLQLAIKAEGSTLIEFTQLLTILFNVSEQSDYLPILWSLAGNKSKPLRALVSGLLAEKDPEAETKAVELLSSKSADIRQSAALILTRFSSSTANNAILGVLHKESNDNARDILLQSLAGTLPAQADKVFIENMVNAAKERGKLNKAVEVWLDESLLPPLLDLSGNELNKDYIRFLLYRMSRVKEMRSDIEAKYIIQLIDKEKSASFALELIKHFIDKEAKPEHKWLMALAALLGNDTVVDKIRVTTNKWMEENRYKMAEHGVGALAIQGSDKALRWVEWYSRKYKSKKANVGAAALAALETAAEELGITIHELGDKVVPDFGFDGLFKHFTVDNEEYRAFIDSNFKIAFFNENNKKLKALPASASAELKEEFKSIAKEVRDIVRSQSSRLEYYLIIQRRWKLEQWQQFFLNNPVMFIYATKLLWGAYDQQGKLLQTFLCTEDTSLVDVNGDEIIPEDGSHIGIVHPSQLDAEQLQQWKKQFFDLSIESIFPQLDRQLPDMKDIDLSKTIVNKYNGKQMVTGSIKSTLERFGWHKGPTGDGGMLDSFMLLNSEENIEAVLELEGVGVGYGWGTEEKTGRLYVLDKSKFGKKWYHSPQNDDDDRLVKLKDLPPIFRNEMLAALEQIRVKES